MLQSGADDLGGTLMEETISRMAGSEHGSAQTVSALTALAASIGRPSRIRTTTYGEVFGDRAAAARQLNGDLASLLSIGEPRPLDVDLACENPA